jgi:hypothetical protein
VRGFFDPFVSYLDAAPEDEAREAILGLTEDWTLLFVVHVVRERASFASFRLGEEHAPNGGCMKTMAERIKRRLRRDRPMTTISIRIPEDVIEDLKEVAPKLGFSGYQPLIRAYLGQGLRKDLARLERPELAELEKSLRRYGIKNEVISAVLGEVAQRQA